MSAVMAPQKARAGAESYGRPSDISIEPRLAYPSPSGRKRCEFSSMALVGYLALPTMISWARMVISTARLNDSTSKPVLSPSRSNLRRLSEARLQAESSRYMYSEQGFEALMREVLSEVCQALMVVSNCSPGSPHSQEAWEMDRHSSRA